MVVSRRDCGLAGVRDDHPPDSPGTRSLMLDAVTGRGGVAMSYLAAGWRAAADRRWLDVLNLGKAGSGAAALAVRIARTAPRRSSSQTVTPIAQWQKFEPEFASAGSAGGTLAVTLEARAARDGCCWMARR